MRFATALFLLVVNNITSTVGSAGDGERIARSVEGLPIEVKAQEVAGKAKTSVIDITGDVQVVEAQLGNKAVVVGNNSNNVNNITHTSSNETVVRNELPYMHGLDEKLQSGALMRGFFVLLGATILLLVYLGVRMFRLSKGHKPPSMVRKYGVLTNRADMEMLPLPLSEDEDDDTVFEINSRTVDR